MRKHAGRKKQTKTIDMKVLFIVQGEGRGHLTQALSLEWMMLRRPELYR